ncbi:MAG TPA: DUF4351 domain-containing protein [Tepidisphaeraceae bacterium]|jgi:hypothetical protein|nr:DUF4351 domain-containing protein [Tepidisphaeraceae bacterium]
MAVTNEWTEAAMEKGMEVGLKIARQEGLERERKLVIRQLQRKLGELSSELLERIATLSLDKIEELGEELLSMQSPNDLNAWLNANTY